MIDFEKISISPKASIKEVISIIDSGGSQIALVIKSNRLLGIVTDGDVRRGLLRGELLDSSVENIMQKNFRFLNESASEEEAVKLMQQHTLHQIPFLDKKGKIVKLFHIENFVKPKSIGNNVIIMAGGKGERLMPLTKNCPKPMLQVAGRPMLEIILNQCIKAGFKEFYLSVNYLKSKIKKHFENGSKWGVSIKYLEETKALGTAGALSLIKKKSNKPILVLNGDVLTGLNYKEMIKFHEDQKASLTVAVRQHETKIPYGVLKIKDQRVMSLNEKPTIAHQVIAGIYLVEPKVLRYVPKNKFFNMTDFISDMIGKGFKVSAFPLHEYWLDVGKPETYERAKGDWQ